MDQQDHNIMKSFTNFLQREYKKEIQEEYELEKKYSLNHTPEEINRRKEFQEKYKFYQLKRNRISYFFGLRKTYRWFRKHYLNLNTKETIEEFEYYKYLKSCYFKLLIKSMFQTSGYTFIFYLWMRLLKHKGKKDLPYLFVINFSLSFFILDRNSYSLILSTALPISYKDIERRKELIEDFVYCDNMSFLLTNELKKISKYYLPDKIEYDFITPTTGQKLSFILSNGRLYITCENYGEVFGYDSNIKPKAKIDNLNAANFRERDVIHGLFKLYDYMIEEYIKKNTINKDAKDMKTELMEEILNENGLNQEKLDDIKNSGLIRNIDFDKLRMGNEKKGHNIEIDKPVKFYF